MPAKQRIVVPAQVLIDNGNALVMLDNPSTGELVINLV